MRTHVIFLIVVVVVIVAHSIAYVVNFEHKRKDYADVYIPTQESDDLGIAHIIYQDGNLTDAVLVSEVVLTKYGLSSGDTVRSVDTINVLLGETVLYILKNEE